MRKTLTAGVVGVAALGAIMVPSAMATHSSITATCEAVTFTYEAFGPSNQPRPTYSITVDGVTTTGTLEPPAGSFTQRVVPLNLAGTHTVSATTEGRPGINAYSTYGPVTFVCGTPAPGPAPTQPQAAPVVTDLGEIVIVLPPKKAKLLPPIVQRAVNCAFIKKNYKPKAGRALAKRRGLVCYKVVLPPKPDKPVSPYGRPSDNIPVAG